MKTELKTSLPRNKVLILLSAASVICGLASCIFGELLLPLLIAPLGALYLFDTSSKKAYSIIVSVVLAVVNVVGLLIGITTTFFALCGITLAVILTYSFKREQSKADSSYLMTVICAFFSFAGCIFLAMSEMGDFSFEAAKIFYTEFHDELREAFLQAAINTPEAGIDPELIATIFDTQVRMIISYFLISGFAVVGLSMKLYSFIVKKCSADEGQISSWRFGTTNIYAYSYIILIIASLFIMSSDNAFSVSVLNLYSFFLAVFAYVGFMSTIDHLSVRMKRSKAVVILLVASLVFSSFAMQILAVVGVMHTLKSNRKDKNAA